MAKPQRDDMATMLEAEADRANAEEQPDWEGIAEVENAYAKGKLDWAAASSALTVLIPEARDDVFQRVAERMKRARP